MMYTMPRKPLKSEMQPGPVHDEPFSDHFPTEQEVRRELAKMGIRRLPDADQIGFRLERHIAQNLLTFTTTSDLASHFLAGSSFTASPFLRDFSRFVLSPWVLALLRALERPRHDHRTLDTTVRNAFNQALQAAHSDGSYGAIAAIHADMSHRMHSTMGAVGTQRFLPWHRIYLMQMEDLLRSKHSGLTIPYWNYSNDAARPDWVWQPPGVTRNTPGASGSLPTQATVDNLITNVSGYTDFTQGIEYNAHNQVHNWCNGTISAPPTAPQDPIFWLLHAKRGSYVGRMAAPSHRNTDFERSR
jgi:hypothetical protein